MFQNVLLFHFNEGAVFWTIFIFAYSVTEAEARVFQNNAHLDSLKSFGFVPVIFLLLQLFSWFRVNKYKCQQVRVPKVV